MIKRLRELNEKVYGPFHRCKPSAITGCAVIEIDHLNHGLVPLVVNSEFMTRDCADLIALSRNMLPDLIALYDAVKNKSYADMKDICNRLEGEGGRGDARK